MKIQKRDIIAGLVCGEIASWFLIFIIRNPYIEEFRKLSQMEGLIWMFPLVFPVIFLIGILVGEWLSKFFKVLGQIVRFGEVGVLNTFVDFGILNLLIGATGITAGAWLAPLNSISFLTASTNSYYWNKFWTFGKRGKLRGGEFLQFLVISGVGWGINTGIVVLGTAFLHPTASFSPGAWVNIMKIAATFISMFWNFLGYKFIVFKK